MQVWAFPAVITEHGSGDFAVAFPDFPEALTGAETFDQARLQAEDALEEAVLGRLAHDEAVPQPRKAAKGETLIPLDPVTAARAALVQIMAEEHMSNVALAKRLGRTEGAVRRLTDGASGVKLDTVLQALAAMGQTSALSVGKAL